MSRKRVNKSSRAKEFCDHLAEVGTHIALGVLNFSHKFCPTVHDCNQVFQVTATRVIILSSVSKGFESSSGTNETGACDAPQYRLRLPSADLDSPRHHDEMLLYEARLSRLQ